MFKLTNMVICDIIKRYMSRKINQERLRTHLMRRVTEAYLDDNSESFDYASQIYDQLTETRRANALAQLALKARIGLNGLPLDKEPKLESTEETSEPIVRSNVIDFDQFVDLPNRRESIRAFNTDGESVFLNFSVAKKLYRCSECRGDIPIGVGHAVMAIVRANKRHNHHHIHTSCVQESVLPKLRKIQTIRYSQSTPTKINEKSRRLRYKQQRAQSS